MEILSALGGAILGAIVSFWISYYFSGKSEQKKALSALATEMKMNSSFSNKILQQNDKIDFESNDGSEWQWCQLIPFSESAWNSLVDLGILLKLPEDFVQAISEAYATAKSANFQAVKIQTGKYHPREGKEYTERVKEAKTSFARALDILSGLK